MRVRECTLVLAMAASLGLAACHRGDSQPGAQASAPGSVGSGNGTQVATPGVDSNAGASSGQKGAVGTTGGGDAAASAMGGPGTGLNGGLAPSGSASQPTPVAPGSSNTTTHGSVGNR